MLQGRTGDPKGLNDYQSTVGQMQGMGQYNPAQLGNHLNDPNSGFNAGMAGLQGMDFSRGMGQSADIGKFSAASGDIGGIMNQVGSRAQLGNAGQYTDPLQQAAAMAAQGAQGNFFNRNSTDTQSPYAVAMQQLLQNNQQRQVADLRARYNMSGGSRGTPAMQAESLYRAQATPELAAAMGQINQTEQGLDLNAANLNSQHQMGMAGLGMQGLTSAGQLGMTGRDQDLQNFLGGRNADISAGNMSVANASQMNQANVAARGQNLENLLQSRGMDISQMGLANNAYQGMAGLGLQGAQYGSSVDQNNVNNGQNSYNSYANLLNNQGNMQLQGGALNLQNANSNTQNIQNALQMMMGSYNQANQLGTPQAQTVQTPGFLGQLGQAASGIGNFMGNISGMNFHNPFGGGGQQMPQFGGTPGIYQTPNNGPGGSIPGTGYMPPFVPPRTNAPYRGY